MIEIQACLEVRNLILDRDLNFRPYQSIRIDLSDWITCKDMIPLSTPSTFFKSSLFHLYQFVTGTMMPWVSTWIDWTYAIRDAMLKDRIVRIDRYHITDLKRTCMYSTNCFSIWLSRLYKAKRSSSSDAHVLYKALLTHDHKEDVFYIVTHGSGKTRSHSFHRGPFESTMMDLPSSPPIPPHVLYASLVLDGSELVMDVTACINEYRSIFSKNSRIILHELCCLLYIHQAIDARALYKALIVLPRIQLHCMDNDTLEETVFKHNDPIVLVS